MSITDQWLERSSEMLDWLNANPQRLQDVYGRVQNENCSVREAITFFMNLSPS